MRQDERRYILENIGKVSIPEIARHLGIKERKLKRYIESENIVPGRSSPERSRKATVEAENPPVKKATHIIYITIVILLVFIAYANALHGTFIWDDEFLVLNNQFIKSFSHAWDIFKSYLAYSSGNLNNFYRPIQELSYMADYHFWKLNPFGFHLTNVILHALCSVLVYVTTFLLFRKSIVAFTVAAIFGVHPVNTEAVTYIAGRADSLYLLFMLLSLSFFIKSINSTDAAINKWLYAASIIFYLLSILSKEIAIIFPVLIFFYVFTFYEKGLLRRRLYSLCIPFTAMAIFYAIARKTILDFSSMTPVFEMARVPFIERVFVAFKAVATYLGILIAPFDLHMERAINVSGIFRDPYAWAAFIVTAIIFAGMIWSYKYSRKAFFACVWFFAGILPVSNTLFPINSFIAEHWLYMPSIGIYMLAGIGVSWLFSERKGAIMPKFAAIFSLSVLLISYTYLTIERNKDWKDEARFFKNTLKHSPNNARLHLNLGNSYLENGDEESALQEYKKASDLDRFDVAALNNIGAIYIGRKDFKNARIYTEKALSIKPDFAPALFMSGALYEEEGNDLKAEECFKKVLDVTPSSVASLRRLGRIYEKRNMTDKAISYWKKILQIDPSNKEASESIKNYAQ